MVYVFLKQFRRIVEGDDPPSKKSEAVDRLIEAAELDSLTIQLVSKKHIARLIEGV